MYIVATPIGNLGDITIRALEVLKSADLVLSENVRKTRNLMKHYGIKTKVLSYREENATQMIPFVLDALRSGRHVALVAEAGTPGISDPGRRLVDAARGEGLSVLPVPGPSAVTAAVSVSGLDEARFAFQGFLPRRRSRRKQLLQEIANHTEQLVFFEAPHRLLRCLTDMREILGDRDCVIGREITKFHEEIEKGRISSFIDKYTRTEPKGEFVIVCEGSKGGQAQVAGETVLKEAMALVKQGIKKTEAAKTIAVKYGLRAKDVYRIIARKSRRREKEDHNDS